MHWSWRQKSLENRRLQSISWRNSCRNWNHACSCDFGKESGNWWLMVKKMGSTLFQGYNATSQIQRDNAVYKLWIKTIRSERLRTDKFVHIAEVWNRFITNCRAAYKPHENITIDKQLFPSKYRRPFLQYMANKPDKFGIKFWVAADTESKYMLNAFPYLGKDEFRPGNQPLSVCYAATNGSIHWGR